ncbi:MAG TPA: hypothetical protein VNJ50_12005 [Gelidibacter sp.]|uniref:hypothetical protein n=1 Tax=Gelidibacter sp. TaxID=2018083 RepID=UPI002C0B5F77|nr:hypothetical protein [Gelidibacter sp.]HXJ99565.1 hypothetical protein [Gelidibacter sp.]
MNKTRIIGLALLIIGIITLSVFENSGINFISGGLISSGGLLLLTGKITAPSF